MMKQKWGRRAASFAVTALILLAALVGNLLLTFFLQKNHVQIDLTREPLYTMSAPFAKEIKEKVKEDVTVTFCADPDVLMTNETTRVVYYMAVDMSLLNDKIKVETVDIERNPGALQQYKTTSASVLSWDSVIVSAKTGYRVASADSFWRTASEGGEFYSYAGEYDIATSILSLLSVHKPVVCVTYGHGEDAPEVAEKRAFYRMLPDKLNAELVFIDLDREEIPDNCVLLIIDGATRDYAADLSLTDTLPTDASAGDYFHYSSPTEKIDRYLDRFGSLFVLKDPFVKLPVLEDLLAEWGMEYTNAQIKDKVLTATADARSRLVAVYANSEEHALGNSFCSSIAALETAPSTIVNRSSAVKTVWEDNNRLFSRTFSALYSPVLLSSADAQAYNEKGELIDRAGDYHLMSVVNRCYTNPDDGTVKYSYVMAAASTEIIADDYIGNNAYANTDVLFSSLRRMSEQKVYSSLDISGNNQGNDYGYFVGGKNLIKNTIAEEDSRVYLYGHYDHNGRTLYKDCAGLSDVERNTVTVLLLLLPVLLVGGAGAWLYLRRRNR